MSIKLICGFEYRSQADDGWINLGSNTGSYSTNTPTSSNGDRSLDRSTGGLGVYTLPLTSGITESWIGAQILLDTTSSSCVFGLGDGTSTEYLTAGIVSGDWVIQINGTTAASSAGAGLAQWHRCHLHVGAVTAGSVVTLYQDGDLSSPVVQYTLTGPDVSGWPGSFSDVLFIMSRSQIDDIWAMDPNDATGTTDPEETLSFSIELLTADSDGPDFTFATGSFSDVDEIPFNLADKITADAVGQIADLSFTNATTAQVIGAIKVTQRTQRSGTTAGSQAEISIDDGSNNNAIETVTVPGDGYIRTYIADAADGTALEVSKLNASTIQIKTVT